MVALSDRLYTFRVGAFLSVADDKFDCVSLKWRLAFFLLCCWFYNSDELTKFWFHQNGFENFLGIDHDYGHWLCLRFSLVIIIAEQPSLWNNWFINMIIGLNMMVVVVRPTDHANTFRVGIILLEMSHAAPWLKAAFEETHLDLQALKEIYLPPKHNSDSICWMSQTGCYQALFLHSRPWGIL